MSKISATKKPPEALAGETGQQKFERLISKEPFVGLKAIFASLPVDLAIICERVKNALSYQELLAKLGFRVVVEKQIHYQDCYSRLGPAGGIRAVLPVHDIATYSTLVTLVNFNSTITTTPKSIVFFDARLAELKSRLNEK
jgi:hypothetical protein